MKYLITVWAMVWSFIYLGWLFVLEVSGQVGDLTERTCVTVSSVFWLCLFLYLVIFQMDKGGEEVRDGE